MDRRTFLALTGATALAGLGGWYLTRPAAPGALPLMAAGAQDSGTTETVELDEIAMGAEDAPVTVIEYASFTCPHCANFHASVLPQIKANYVDTGKVRFVYREVFFDRFGLWAALVARCAGPERYMGVAGMLYEKQKDWIGDGQPATIGNNLRTLGKTAGLSQEQLDACLADEALAKSLVAAFQKNAEADGIDSTPSFVIDGQKYSNMPYDEFAKLLDEKLAG